MHFPNSIHAEGWNPKQQLSSGNSNMKPLHAQGVQRTPRYQMPLLLLGVTLSLAAGVAALSTIFSPKSVDEQWQAMDGLAAPGAGQNQIAQAPVAPSAPLPEVLPAVEPTQPEPTPSAGATQPELMPAEPARPAVMPAPERKPQPTPQPVPQRERPVTKTLTPPEPVPVIPPVIDPPAVITLPQPAPATAVPPLTPASTPASAPPAPQPASTPPSSPASDPPKSDPPKPQVPPEQPKAAPLQG